MHVVGVRFERAVEARAALAELRDHFGLEAGQVDVRPLGSTDYGDRVEAHLLAGQFEDHAVAEVLALVRRRGGLVVELRTDGPNPSVVERAPGLVTAGHAAVRGGPRAPRPIGPSSGPTRSSRAVRARAPRPRRVSR